MKHPPCKTCSKKGCGSFHDKCTLYSEWALERKRLLERNKQMNIDTNDRVSRIRI